MPTYNGTHGTTVQRANSIFHNGFDPTEVGRSGYGVYFWKYHENDAIARDLAIGWFADCNRRKVYNDENDPKCAIIFGSFDADDDDVLVITSEILEAIALMVYDLPGINDDDIHGAYEAMIKRTEDAIGRSVALIQSAVPAPKKMAFKVQQIIGNPAIFVVRKNFDQIKRRLVVPQ